MICIGCLEKFPSWEGCTESVKGDMSLSRERYVPKGVFGSYTTKLVKEEIIMKSMVTILLGIMAVLVIGTALWVPGADAQDTVSSLYLETLVVETWTPQIDVHLCQAIRVTAMSEESCPS